MKAKVFFDTTILVYAVTSDGPRSIVAERLLATGGAISVQVLNEFTAVARRKLKMPWDELTAALEAIRTLCATPSPLTVQIHEDALALAAKHGFNIYDALIVASAIDAGCTTLYSEDMQHGQRIGSLTIRNPFA
jgi:predicted nucleic acid-binding protein